MYLDDLHHVSRHVPYRKTLRDDDDNPVGLYPQTFETREKEGETQLSVNWLEYFGEEHSKNITKMVHSFRRSRSGRIGALSIFAIGNVGALKDICTKLLFNKVRVLYDGEKRPKYYKSHASIIRLPMNNDGIMNAFASDVFTELVPNKNIE